MIAALLSQAGPLKAGQRNEQYVYKTYLNVLLFLGCFKGLQGQESNRTTAVLWLNKDWLGLCGLVFR